MKALKIEMIYDTDSDGITVKGYTVTAEIEKVTTFHTFPNHKAMSDFTRSIDPDFVVYPNGNFYVKPGSLA